MGYVSDNLALLSDIAKAIAMEFGENCEVVLHDLTLPYDSTIVGIWNGHVTGRKIGDGGTNAGLKILKSSAKIEDQCYINTLPNGKVLRSTSKYFRDEYGKVNGSLCINLDITALINGANYITPLLTSNNSIDTPSPEFFSGNIDEILEQMIDEAIRSVQKPIAEMSKEDKVKIVKELDNKGFFLVKKSTEQLADVLGLSRFSIYNYLKEDSCE